MKRIFSAFVLLSILFTSLFFIAPDEDHDGIPDMVDSCPNTAQLQIVSASFRYSIAVNPDRLSKTPRSWPVNLLGCEPDSDSDGIKNSMDYCPEDTPEMIAKGVAENGCPLHSDQDGTPDYRDKCPGTPGGVRTDQSGCPVVASGETTRK